MKSFPKYLLMEPRGIIFQLCVLLLEKILHFFEGSDCENDDESDKHLGRFEMKIILIRRKKRK